MANAFANAISIAQSQMRLVAGTAVTYHRNEDSVAVTAVKGATTFESDDGEGVTIESKAADWIVAAGSLVLDEAAITPERGDLIKETVAGVVHVYEAIGPGNEPVYREADRYGNNLRIHTRYVGTA